MHSTTPTLTDSDASQLGQVTNQLQTMQQQSADTAQLLTLMKQQLEAQNSRMEAMDVREKLNTSAPSPTVSTCARNGGSRLLCCT